MVKQDRIQDSGAVLIGAHQSVAGGIHRAFERASALNCRTMQIFTKNSSRWSAVPLTAGDVASYKTAGSKSSVDPVVAHDSYLINLCARDGELLRKSRDAFIDEIERCALLGIPFLNFHPGSHMGSGESDGIKKIIESIDRAHSRTEGFKVVSVLETTAGQGTSLGYRFEHLKKIIDGVEDSRRTAVCIDTCHVFAAGYDIRSENTYMAVMREFDDVIGLDKLAVIHVNDSLKGLNSRIDRHQHIGMGEIGIQGFRHLMTDERLKKIPKILETPKGDGVKYDRRNLDTLRRLARREKMPDYYGR